MSTHLFDPEVAFDIVYSQFGGKWKLPDEGLGAQSNLLKYVESIPSALVGAAEGMMARAKDAEGIRIPEMHFGLLDTQTLNCFASQLGNRYYVGISAMMPIALLELSARFFAREEFLPEIGDVKQAPFVVLDGLEETPLFQIAENRFSPRISERLGNDEAEHLARSIAVLRGAAVRMSDTSGRRLGANAYIRQFHTLIDYLLPTCPVRRLHAEYAVGIIAHFFWFHEIAHVTQGHLRSLQQLHDLPRVRLFEFPDPMYTDYGRGAARLENSHQLALELDADVEAALLTMGLIMIDADIESDEAPYVAKHERAKIFAFMLLAVFGAISRNAERRSAAASLTHPPARVRLTQLYRYFLDFTSHDEVLNAAIHDGVRLAQFHGHQYSAEDYLRSVLQFSDDDINEALRIDAMRKDINNAYDNYGFGNLRVLARSFMDDMRFLDRLKPEYPDRSHQPMDRHPD